MTSQIILDNSERERALDPSRSFIVQAPAGSGKTELLTQRYLRLLSQVDEPEEILAITFTRKAAAEMSNRIVKALIKSGSEPRPEETHTGKTWDLAKNALERNRKLGWNILNNPARLKIRTIDSFCLYLTGRMPILSGMGGEVQVMENPDSIYEEAAQNTLLELKKESRWYEPLSKILLYHDNDWNRVKVLIVEMLRLREHWIRLVSSASGDQDLRNILEGHLGQEVERHLKKVLSLFNQFISQDKQRILAQCSAYAAKNLSSENPDSRIAALKDLSSLPGAETRDLEKWIGIKQLLQTSAGSSRKGVDKRLGFPPMDSFKDEALKKLADQKKAEFQDLLCTLSRHTVLEETLADLKNLPDTSYIDETWEILSALLKVLKMAVAQLHLVMQDLARVDYPEISMAALHALGERDNPSELMLRLDYQLKHILFDEFQDTSISQQEMLARLVSGWTPGDGRTLFLVGDPMQSIYGFRDADVGVFLSARQKGIGDILLEPLSLRVNFRSEPSVVDWVNRIFPSVFQNIEDHVSGSVEYSPMLAAKKTLGQVKVHPLIEPRVGEEALLVSQIINETTNEHPGENIAVLVRSRTHLTEIVTMLRRKNISFQAVELEPLRDRQVVMDLLSLTRALLRPRDNLSWLCVLRAPWAGLDLKDLSRLSFPGDHMTILEKMYNLEEIQGLSMDGYKRLKKMSQIFVPAWENRLRRPLVRLVEGVWTALGGPACAGSSQELKDAGAFLAHLESYEQNQPVEDIADFEQSLQGLFSKPDPEKNGFLQIMTIHKAKGLEFDTVILPGLDKVPRSSAKLLLQFTEVPSEERESSFARLLLAPMASYGEENHPTYKFIENLKKSKEEHEIGRLIYVAVTRARKRLHLLASCGLNNSRNKSSILSKPHKKSLLSPLWKELEKEFEEAYDPEEQSRVNFNGQKKKKENLLIRLSSDWGLPQITGHCFSGMLNESFDEDSVEPVAYHWAGEAIRQIGIKVHGLLARIAEEGLDKWDQKKVQEITGQIRKGLSRTGVSRHDLDFASSKVIQAIENTLTHDRGRWILFRHNEAQCEYGLSAVLGREVVRVVIDRTFIDENGTRWIIDYKTSLHEGGGLEDFLHAEVERYQGQLRKYLRIFRMMEHRTARAGIYFPLLKAWREIRD